MFSSRTNWIRQPNRLSALLEERRRRGDTLFDLTVSNPTVCGFRYPREEIREIFVQASTHSYQPDPRGLPVARESIAQLESAVLKPYHLRYDGTWNVDVSSVRTSLSPRTRALLLVHPHNPTGMFLKREEYHAIKSVALEYRLALIVDEVFSDYPWGEDDARCVTSAGEREVLTFTLNGVSKLLGLPQYKLGWVVVNGPGEVHREAIGRLEIVNDAYLSASTPVQVALPRLMSVCENVRQEILERVKANFSVLRQREGSGSPVSVLASEGGWHAIVRVPGIMSDEEWALELLKRAGVYVLPGYFFEFEKDTVLVVSLLPQPEIFRRGIELLFEQVELLSHTA
jgi:alanine-synthesizing transaminase